MQTVYLPVTTQRNNIVLYFAIHKTQCDALSLWFPDLTEDKVTVLTETVHANNVNT
jgi:hypothetical protein